jgi:hypothetical protein
MGHVGTPMKICEKCDFFYRYTPECPKCKTEREPFEEAFVESGDRIRDAIDKSILEEVKENAILELVEKWHLGTSELELHEYLGLSWAEYSEWIKG